MKRSRTGSFAKPVSRMATLPTLAGHPRATAGVNRRLSTAERRQVKQLINAAAPKSTLHNSATSGTAPVTGALNQAITSILAFTAIKQGLSEDQRRGDQVWIRKIHFKCYLTSTAIQDQVRIIVARAPHVSGSPLPIDFTQLLQNAGAGIPGIISTYQDDQPYQVLHDKVYQVGNQTSVWGAKEVDFTLDFSKRPLKAVFLDGTAISGPSTTVMGDIELAAATRGVTGTTTMTYVYDVEFTEK